MTIQLAPRRTRHAVRVFLACALAPLVLGLGGCGDSGNGAPDDAVPIVERDLMPGDELPVDQGVTLEISGAYGLPTGIFELFLLCDGTLDFTAEAASGATTSGSCSTGIATAVVEGPGTLGLTFSPGGSVLLSLTLP